MPLLNGTPDELPSRGPGGAHDTAVISIKCCPPMLLMVVASMVPMVEASVSPLASIRVGSVPPMWAGSVVAASMADGGIGAGSDTCFPDIGGTNVRKHRCLRQHRCLRHRWGRREPSVAMVEASVVHVGVDLPPMPRTGIPGPPRNEGLCTHTYI